MGRPWKFYRCLHNSAIANIPWTEAGLGLSGFVVGLLHTLIATVQGTDWTALGQNIVSMVSAIDWVGLFSAMGTLAIDVLQAINGILGQVDWGAVGQKIMECIEAVDWAGVLSQLGEIINNNWPLLLAILGAALLPQISTFILSSVLGCAFERLGRLHRLGRGVHWPLAAFAGGRGLGYLGRDHRNPAQARRRHPSRCGQVRRDHRRHHSQRR